MALRIRKDRKTIICAAESEPLEGDCYLDDEVHYVLSEMKILKIIGKNSDFWQFNLRKEK